MKRLLSILLAGTVMIGLALPAFAAPALKDKPARELLRQVNRERYEARLRQLKWDDDLEKAAKLRAREIVADYNRDHLRPGGARFYTLSTKVWAENLARDYTTPSGVMGGWLRSETHRENILYPDYTLFAAACAEDDDGVLYWVQLFGNGKPNTGWTGATEYTLDPFDLKEVTLKSAAELAESVPEGARLGNPVYKNGLVNPDRIAAELQSAEGPVTVTVSGAKGITADAIRSLAVADKDKRLTLRAETLSDSGRVQGRIDLRPAKLGKAAEDIQLGVYGDAASTADLRALAEERLDMGANAAYIHMAHQGRLHARTRVSARVELGALNRDKLLLYRWSGTLPSPILLEDADYSVDQDGFLTFYTKVAGEILITDKPIASAQ